MSKLSADSKTQPKLGMTDLVGQAVPNDRFAKHLEHLEDGEIAFNWVVRRLP